VVQEVTRAVGTLCERVKVERKVGKETVGW